MRYRESAQRRSTMIGRLLAAGLAAALGVAAAPAAGAATNPLVRFPTLHGNRIVFEAAGDLWAVNRTGGVAERLTADRGFDMMPRFSPDGKTIAFTGQYDGGTDVYTIPAEGGTATRMTYHSDVVKQAPMRWGPDNMVLGWTPDGSAIVFLSRRDTYNSWFGRIFAVPRAGGLPTALPLPKGGTLSFSPDGGKIAYNRIFRNFRTWKRYDGGLAQDIWIYDLKTHDIRRVTTWKGTDTYPMWYHDTIYFASDRDANRRLNIWAYSLKDGSFRQVTHFTKYDVDWPSLGDDGIVFACGGRLYVIDLPSETMHELDISVPDDGIQLRPRWADVSKSIEDFDIAPNGKRALFTARGELLTVPKKHGNTRDITRTPGARERDAAWSPDGKLVAYVTDASGQDQIAVRPADGTGKETVLTRRTAGYLEGPRWSPDGSMIAFSDSDHVLWYVVVKSKKVVRVDKDPYAEMGDYTFSPHGGWITYSKAQVNHMRQVYLYNIASGKVTRVGNGMTNDSEPVFGSAGKLLFFISSRHPNPVFSETEFNEATVKMDGIYAATLRADLPSPFAPRSDEGVVKKKAGGKPAKAGAKGKAEAAGNEAVKIDLEGLYERAVAVPIPAADIADLNVVSGRLYYMTRPVSALSGPLPGEQSKLHVYDLEKRKDTVIASPVDGYAVSADGSSVLVAAKGKYVIRSAKPQAKDPQAASLDLGRMKVRVDPPAEWREMYEQAWRLERDYFYNPKMNGVDWPAVRAQYEPLVAKCLCREDLNYVIGEMQGELGNSHTYVGGGDVQRNGYVPVGLLGVDFGLDRASGRYFFERIYPGDNSREETRSPLTEPGVNVHRGMFLLAVDGVELEAPTNPYAPFVNTLGRTVRLTVAEDAAGKGRRTVTVKPIANELEIRLKAWIDANRKKVAEASGGRLGYIYLSDMEEQGMEQFIRQFYPQVRKQGMIIDVRYNGGGFIDQIVLERLRRVLVGMETTRQGMPFPIPGAMVHGPLVCLANHYSASDGDIFPFYFKKYGLGPVIGTRTWGGVRGIRGYWRLMDGGYITVPEFSLYGLKSQWVLENHGVEPDIEVDDLPGDVIAGRDAQLQKGIEVLLAKIEANPPVLPKRPPLLPAYPPKGIPAAE